MIRIYISYRRADSHPETKRLHDDLLRTFDKQNVLKDVDTTIPLEEDARRVIAEIVSKCDVVVVVIGPDWLEIKAERGNYRLKNPNDLGRIEIETALAHDIRLVPILLGSTQMPEPNKLPVNLQGLTTAQKVFTLRDDPYFEEDVIQLINYLVNIEKHL